MISEIRVILPQPILNDLLKTIYGRKNNESGTTKTSLEAKMRTERN